MLNLTKRNVGLAGSILLLAGLFSQPVFAETASVVSSENWQKSQANSLTLRRAERSLKSSMDALGITAWDNTRITASGQATNLINDELETEYSATIDLSVPITHSVSLGATLTSEQNAILSASFQPFADATVTPEMTLSYDKAVINLADTQRSLFSQLENAEMNLRLAQSSASLAKQTLELTHEELSVIEAKFNAGEATTADVLDAQTAASEAQQSFYSNQVTLIEASQSLQQLLKLDAVEVADLSFADLQTLVELRSSILDASADKTVTSSNLDTLTAELKSLKSVAQNLDWFDSDLTFNAEYDVQQATAKAGVSINLSPAQFQQDEQIDAELDISLKQMEIRNEQATLELQKAVLSEQIDIQQAALDAALSDQAASQITLDETRYLGKLGERTPLEVRQAMLNTAQADARVFSALVHVYLAQSDLLTLYGNLF